MMGWLGRKNPPTKTSIMEVLNLVKMILLDIEVGGVSRNVASWQKQGWITWSLAGYCYSSTNKQILMKIVLLLICFHFIIPTHYCPTDPPTHPLFYLLIIATQIITTLLSPIPCVNTISHKLNIYECSGIYETLRVSSTCEYWTSYLILEK